MLDSDLLGSFVFLFFELSRGFDFIEETHDLLYIVFFAGFLEGETDEAHVLLDEQ